MKFQFAAAFAAAFACHTAAAQPTTLDTMVVTGTRTASDPAQLPDAISVIGRAEIESSAAASLAELLRGRAGVEIIDFYGDGSRASVGMRGFGANAPSNTLITVNGRPLNNPDIGAADLGRIQLADIDRIEILQGGSAFYGDQAVGGVINIITRRPGTPDAAFRTRAGSYQHRSGRAVVRAGREALHAALSATALRTDNYRRHNRLDRQAANLRLGGRDEALSWWLDGEYTNEELQTPGGLLAAEAAADRRQSAADFADDFSNARTTDLAAGIDWQPTANWRMAAQSGERESTGRFRLSFRGFPTEPATQDRKIRNLDLRLLHSFMLGGRKGTAVLGADLRRADYLLVSQFGEQINQQDLDDFYLGATLPLAQDLDTTFALRQSNTTDHLRDRGEFASLPDGKRIKHSETTASLGYSWRPHDGLKLFAGWDQVLRYPKVDEYFGSGFTPDTIALTPQTGDSFELGAQWQIAGLNLSATMFHLALRDEIVFDPNANGFGANVNLDSSRRQGVLLDAQWAASARWRISFAYTFVNAELRSGSRKGRDIPLVAEQLGRFAVDWLADGHWSMRAELQGSGARGLGGDFDSSLAPLPGYAVLNLVAAHGRNRWRFSARLNNVLGRKYAEQGFEARLAPDFSEQATHFPMPEFNALVSAEYRI